MLDYFPNADHAGIYAALAAGEYQKAGLDLTIQTPPDPSAPIKLLNAGRADLAISYEPELFLARDRNLDLVSVGALVQRPLTSVIALGDRKVKSIRDLKGKTVGTAGIPYQSAYLKTILKKAQVNPKSVKEVNVGYNLLPAMISHRVDATLGGFWNYEGISLRQLKKKPTVLRIDSLGVPTYNELIFVARRNELSGSAASKIRRFLQATARGYEKLKTDPKYGVDALLKNTETGDAKLQLASAKATLPYLFPTNQKQPFGYQQPSDWDMYAKWMYDNKLINTIPQPERALTNNLLPGIGLKSGS
jgi:putative hydroxymethylpyrimidine transport system substrate-binding protein